LSNELNGLDFTRIVQQIISEEISGFTKEQSVNGIAKRTIYVDLLENCWMPGKEMRGSGSIY
jgi:hypothetical protein